MDFGNLYNYSTTNGIVIPATSSIRGKVEECFKSIFGNDFDTTSETAGGRLIEAITFLFIDVLGVNAQNASFLSPKYAVGSLLDNIGGMFGVVRLEGESDSEYRKRILAGQSLGIGFDKSIMRGISSVSGVTSISVINNGGPDPKVIPNNEHGVAVDAHSVYICVGGGNSLDIAMAIHNTISAGCGYHDSGESTEYGQKVEEEWTDESTGTPVFVRFYRPITVEIEIDSTCVNINHDPLTVEDDVKNIISEYISSHNTNCTVTPSEIISAVASKNIDAYIQNCSFKVKNSGGVFIDTDKFTFFPYTAASLDPSKNMVTVI